MRKLIIIAAGLLTIFNSCSHSGSGGSTTTTPLNSTETQLIGTWYLKSENQKIGTTYDTTFTGYSASSYAQFTSNAYLPGNGFPANYKSMTDAFLGATPAATIVAVPEYWYYDATTSFLIISGSQFTITAISSSSLTLEHNLSGEVTTYYFSK